MSHSKSAAGAESNHRRTGLVRLLRGLALGALLLVLAVSGGLLGGFSSVMTEPWEKRIRRQAQEAASLHGSALHSGASFAGSDSSIEDIVAALENGVTVTDSASPFHGKRFSLGRIDAPDRAAVIKCLQLRGGFLAFEFAPQISREAAWRRVKLNWSRFGNDLRDLIR